MTKEQVEALKAVEKINYKLYSLYEKDNKLDCQPIVTILLADMYFSISITIPDEFNPQEILLYNSENNDRIYYESTDKYETFPKLIERKFNEVKSELNKINL
jgi:hypothetical protein